MASTLDTHRAVKQLQEAGADVRLAEAVVQLWQDGRQADMAHLATKADLEALRLATKADLETLHLATKADLETLRLATKADLETLRLATKADLAELRHEIEALRLATRADLEALRTELRLLEHRLTIRLGMMLAAAVVIVGALAALL